MARIGGRPRLTADGEEDNAPFVQALAHGLTILTLFDVEHPVWSLGDITRQTGISKTTAYRMLRTLERTGFVTFNSATERYNIGSAILPIAYLTLSYVGFSHLTHPVLEQLAAVTGETVELAMEGKGEAVIVDHVDTSHPFKPNLPLGRVLRHLANSSMKVFAAYQTEQERERLLRAPHAALTPYTITDPAHLRAELRKVVETGVAFDMQEQDLGICAVSAPVFDTYGKIKAVVSVIAPAERFDIESGRRNVEAVRGAAEALTGYLSQPPSPPSTP